MKVLLTSYWCLTEAGGLFTYVKMLLRGLERRGIEVDVLTRDASYTNYYLYRAGRSLSIEKIKGVIGPKVQAYYHYRFPGIDPWLVECEAERYSFEAAASQFDLPSYDLIHAQEVISARAVSRVKPPQIPLVSTLHGAWPLEAAMQGYVHERQGQGWHYAVAQERLAITASDQVILPSRWLHSIVVDELGIPLEQATIIPFGMDVADLQAEFTGGEKQATGPQGKKVIAYTARLCKGKGHEILFAALAKLKTERDDFVCWVIGDGAKRQELEQCCQQLCLTDHVAFLGAREDVPALLAQVDICVHPAVYENQSYAVKEAQAAGKPVVASDVGGIPEQVQHGQTGWLVPAGDAEAWSAQLRLLLDDAELCKKIGTAGRRWAQEEWALDTMLDRTIRVYQKAAAQKGRGGV